MNRNQALSDTVGRSGRNLREDTMLVQSLLRSRPESRTLRIDGIFGPRTGEALERFQRAIGLPDAVDPITPDGVTIQALRKGPDARRPPCVDASVVKFLRDAGVPLRDFYVLIYEGGAKEVLKTIKTTGKVAELGYLYAFTRKIGFSHLEFVKSFKSADIDLLPVFMKSPDFQQRILRVHGKVADRLGRRWLSIKGGLKSLSIVMGFLEAIYQVSERQYGAAVAALYDLFNGVSRVAGGPTVVMPWDMVLRLVADLIKMLGGDSPAAEHAYRLLSSFSPSKLAASGVDSMVSFADWYFNASEGDLRQLDRLVERMREKGLGYFVDTGEGLADVAEGVRQFGMSDYRNLLYTVAVGTKEGLADTATELRRFDSADFRNLLDTVARDLGFASTP